MYIMFKCVWVALEYLTVYLPVHEVGGTGVLLYICWCRVWEVIGCCYIYIYLLVQGVGGAGVL